jgi:lysophospholipase L1-like esterase
MDIQPNSKLIMIGDSVTDCERARPVGEGLFDALGKGYVSLVEGILNVSYPAHRIRVVNMGVAGDNVRDLKGRWQTDVLDLKPDWLSILIGINDVWRQFDTPSQVEWHVNLDEYERTLEELVRLTSPVLKGLVLMTPYFIEPNQADVMRVTMDRYGEVVRVLSQKYRSYFVDTQAAFDETLKHFHPMALAWDRVHPNRTGHMILARAFLKAVGYSEF